jgi:hypothetical protein
LSVPTAELTAPAIAPPDKTRPGGVPGALSGGRFYLVLGGAALVIAAFSLLIPSTPSYDPWAWLVWGREIVHFKLHTTGGPSWKPLPVIFTTAFAPFGNAAPDLWLVIARAGAVMAVVMTCKVAWRLMRGLGGPVTAATGSERVWRAMPALLAGVIAAGSLINSRGFISDNALGYSEGLMTALVLISFDRHLDGARRQAFVVGFFAALDRPELWLLWGPYGLYLWWKDRGARRLVVILFGLIPVLWFLPELWGSGHLFRGVTRAHNPRSNSAAFASCPFCTEFSQHAWPTVLMRIKAVALLTMAAAAFGLWRVRRTLSHGGFANPATAARAALLVVGATGFGWWIGIAAETQAGFSGNDRYLVLGVSLVSITGAVGWAWAAQTVARAIQRVGPVVGERRLPSVVAGAVGLLAVVAVFVAFPPWLGSNLIDVQATHRALVYQADLRTDLTKAVRELGGPAKILACGPVMTEGFQVPMVAWTFGVHTLQIEASPVSPPPPTAPGPSVIFQTRDTRSASLLPFLSDWPNTHYKEVARVRTFRVFSTCPLRVSA